LLEKLIDLLRHNITPVVPIRGTISASGDLAPMSYIASAIIGSPAISAYTGPVGIETRRIVPAPFTLKEAGLLPLPLAPKEHLGLLNGTAFSSAVASLVLAECMQITMLAQICTAMGTEALLGTRGSFSPFIHEVARPHSGQVEVAKLLARLLDGSRLAGEADEVEVTIQEDSGTLRQVDLVLLLE
jgi:phenylalanine ammonia-lyase